MIESPKIHWSTKVIMGLFFLLSLLLGLLWFSREYHSSWIHQLVQSRKAGETLTPTASVTLSPTATEFPEGTPWVQAIDITPVRSGPGDEFEEIAMLTPGQQARVIGMSADEAWWAINLPYLASGRGWILKDSVQAKNTLSVEVISGGELTEAEGGKTTKGKAQVNVNVRSGPGMNFQKVGALEAEDEALIIGVDSAKDWYLIEIPGVRKEEGWVSVDYISAQNTDGLPVVRYQPPNANRDVPTPAPGKPALMAQAVVNIRSGPDTIFQVLGKLEIGQQAEVVGTSADNRWYAIKYTPADSGRAWVAADFVEIENGDDLPVLH